MSIIEELKRHLGGQGLLVAGDFARIDLMRPSGAVLSDPCGDGCECTTCDPYGWEYYERRWQWESAGFDADELVVRIDPRRRPWGRRPGERFRVPSRVPLIDRW